MTIRDRLIEIADDQQDFDRKILELIDNHTCNAQVSAMANRLTKQLDRSLTELVLEVLSKEEV